MQASVGIFSRLAKLQLGQVSKDSSTLISSDRESHHRVPKHSAASSLRAHAFHTRCRRQTASGCCAQSHAAAHSWSRPEECCGNSKQPVFGSPTHPISNTLDDDPTRSSRGSIP